MVLQVVSDLYERKCGANTHLVSRFTNYGVGAPLNDYCHALQSGRKNNWETYDDRPGDLDHSICFGTADETDPARTGT
jgi:hypothetical protein